MKIVVAVLQCYVTSLAQSISVTPSTTAYVFSNGVSVPADYPHVKIAAVSQTFRPDSGLIFINNWGGTPYIAILDYNGEPVFYRTMPANARDFKVQPNGMLSYRLADPYYRFYEMDSSYSVTREITAKNGYGTDEHELQMLPNGNVLLIALDYRTVDMSARVLGGKPSATIVGNHIQEISPEGEVVFEWKCWDNFLITDAVHENLTAQSIDYVHMNAIAVDSDSNILISSRHLSEVTKINRKTGQIMWRLGGAHNQFTFLNDPDSGFSYQHDIRALPNGHYTVMDNGNFHSPSHSRAVEYAIDTVAWTATLVWQYRHSPDPFTWWMGNALRLPNGNTLINWADGSLPKLTEVTPEGAKAMELGFLSYAHSYRVFKFPWKGKPKAPVLSATKGPEQVTLLLNYFDQAPKHHFMIYCDTIPAPTRLIDSTDYGAVDISGLINGKRYYFRITNKDSNGIETPYSNEESIVAKFIAPGENLVVNGDFSNGMDQWNFFIGSPASGNSYITTAGEYFVQIGNGGTQAWHVQLVQAGIPLYNGKNYRFEFDAYAVSNRFLDVKLEKASNPYTNYSKTGSVYLTGTKKHFSFDFTMQEISDATARVTFNLGLSDVDAFLDNVSVKQLVPQEVIRHDLMIPDGYTLQQNFPNPFNPSTSIRYGVPVNSKVKLSIYNVIGQAVAELLNGESEAGWHEIRWNATVSAGLYFCVLEYNNGSSGQEPGRLVHKMVLLK